MPEAEGRVENTPKMTRWTNFRSSVLQHSVDRHSAPETAPTSACCSNVVSQHPRIVGTP